MELRPTIIRFLVRINKRCASRKSSTWKNLVAKASHYCTSILIDLMVAITNKTVSLKDSDQIKSAAAGLVRNADDTMAGAQAMCQFINREVTYYPFDRWLSPNTVLKCKIGDCKNQAQLLRELLACIGVESEIKVGVIDKVSKYPRIHAWLTFDIEDNIWIADPTVSDELMTMPDYQKAINGFIDVTDEYRRANKASVCYE